MIHKIKAKLAYEWKNIYRGLSNEEIYPRGEGLVSIKSLESVLMKLRVYLDRDQISYIKKQFGET